MRRKRRVIAATSRRDARQLLRRPVGGVDVGVYRTEDATRRGFDRRRRGATDDRALDVRRAQVELRRCVGGAAQ